MITFALLWSLRRQNQHVVFSILWVAAIAVVVCATVLVFKLYFAIAVTLIDLLTAIMLTVTALLNRD